MTDNKHTAGAWYKVWNGNYWDVQDNPKLHSPSKVGCIGFTNEDSANIASAAPELNSVCSNFEIQYKEGDGDYWLVFNNKSGDPSGAINLGRPSFIVLKALKIFEEDRKKAIKKAKGNQ